MNKRFALVAVGAALSLSLTACGGEGAGGGGTEGGENASAAPEDLTIGVAMPTQTSERWIADGANVEKQLTDLGYQVDLQYANDDIPTQQAQLDTMISGGADVLIIAAIDGTALGSQLDAAGAAGIPVISYDRLIRDNENVDFYVSFDNYNVGVQQATSLLVGLGLLNADGSPNPSAPAGPFNIELFAGSLDDNNAGFFFDGAIDTLQPFIDAGTLVVKSGQTSIEQVNTQRWDGAVAQSRMETLLTGTYNDGSVVNGVLSPYDGISRGIITALQNNGYGTSAKPIPVVSGQDAEIASVKLINDGVQYATIFKDTRLLAEQAVSASQAFLEGGEPEANDTETYNNGVKVVPSYLLDSTIIYKDNITSELVDSGYYTQAEVDAGQSS